jgi:hypothetical protein
MNRSKSFSGKTRRALTVALVLAMLLALCAAPALALKLGDKPPNSFWAVFTPYETALNNGDTKGIAENGRAIINYWLNGRTAEAASAAFIKNGDTYEINSLWATADTIAPAFEKLGRYDEAVAIYKQALFFADAYKVTLAANPADMEFAKQKIQAKIAAYDTDIGLYAEVSGSAGAVSFGAKNEPASGVYFGAPEQRELGARDSSGAIVYVVWENESLPERMIHAINNGGVLDKHSVIEVAWNFVGEGATLKNVPNESAKVKEAAAYLKELGVPVLLRLGAEMNVWQVPANPKEFITAFRFVADIIHREAPNVAMVWSVNYISAAGLTYDMFYPGDSYVDWVGTSLYTVKYFNNDRNQSESTQAIYGTGKFANPLQWLAPLVEQYGSRKPIIIAEGGVSVKDLINGEDLTSWAKKQLRIAYGYAPVLYPQLKAVFYFNRPYGARYSHELTGNAEMTALYSSLTSSSYFLGKGATSSPVSYVNVDKAGAAVPASAVKLITYAPFFTMDNVNVTYRVDGEWKALTRDIPYAQTLNLSSLSDGTHTLTIEVKDGDAALKTKTYKLVKSGANVALGDKAPVLPDSPSSWAVNDVTAAIAAGLVPASLQKNYTKPVSRGAVAQMFINLIEKASGKSIDAFLAEKGVTVNASAFSDTTDKAVLAANALGIINGDGGKFNPNGVLTRAQIAAIICRTARALGYDTAGYKHGFTDITGSNAWVDAELGWPYEKGIVDGIGGGKFNPGGQLTTQEAIAITYRALDKVFS